MEELQDKLNKEYISIWEINIQDMHEENVSINHITYVKEIMENIDPLDLTDPIILAKEYSWSDKYIIIDGYHRMKNALNKWLNSINAIILDEYEITRRNDTLFEFLSCNVWNTIKFISDYIVFVWENMYHIIPNEWCGGCSNWWSNISVCEEFLKKEVHIKTLYNKEWKYKDLYDLYINNQKIAEIDTWRWNWYYWWDFEIEIIK